MTDYKYRSAYKTYKKLPTISFVITFILSFVWAIIDFSEDITGLGIEGFVTWSVTGLFLGAIVMWLTTIAISPTVVRTDAICELVDLAKE